MPAARMYVEAPTTTTYQFGLLSVAEVSPLTDPHWQQGVEWDSDNCSPDLDSSGAYCTTPTGGTNEVQTITVTSGTGGSFTLSFQGETTSTIAYNATAATVQSALEGLSQVDPGDITVTGGALNTAPVTVTFTGPRYGARNVPNITVGTSTVTGAGSAVGAVTGTQGVAPVKTVRDQPASSNADPFVLYGLTGCRAPGSWAEATDRAMKRFVAAESRGVEKVLWGRLTAASSGITDLSQATAPPPEIGVAILEGWLSSRYGGAGTLHAARTIGSILGTRRTVERRGNRMETVLGMGVAAGAGYDYTKGINGASAPAGEGWLFATGNVVMYRGVANTQGPFMVQAPLDNTMTVLVERTYLQAIDCFPAVAAGLKVKVA